MTWTVAALYRFTPLCELPILKADLTAFCDARGICGTLLIANEGINGTIAGAAIAVTEVLDELDRRFGIRQSEVKLSSASDKPFTRMKVRIRPEIITMRAPEADPNVRAGTYVEPSDWNALLADPDVMVLDTRNRYETRVGTFEGAIDPQIDSFTEFKDFVGKALDPGRQRKVAMFCTGGIRCEKASSYMLAHGFETVFHLKGGILKYLEDVAPRESRWQGDCYVFDSRVAVGHGLQETDWDRCFGCGAPLTPDDVTAPSFEIGVSCPHCFNRQSPEKAAGLRIRHRQRTTLGGN